MTIDKKVLYEINMPFGLLDPEIAQALKNSGGPWEFYGEKGWIEFDPAFRFSPGITCRLKRPDPPMTTDEFIAAAMRTDGGLVSDGDAWCVWQALLAWSQGKHDEALRLIGHTPEAPK